MELRVIPWVSGRGSPTVRELIKILLVALAERLDLVDQDDIINYVRYQRDHWRSMYMGESLKNWLLRREKFGYEGWDYERKRSV
jgi:hypothetical protein